MYDFVTKFEKVCLAFVVLVLFFCFSVWLIAPKFEVPQGWPLTGMLVLHYQVYGEERFPKLFFLQKVTRPFR